MDESPILTERRDGYRIITLNRPEAMNAWTPQLSDELTIAMGMADTDDTVRVIVVTGAGRAFCAGADMGTLQAIPSGDAAKKPAREEKSIVEGRTQDEITRIPKPVISVVNGAAASKATISLGGVAFTADVAELTAIASNANRRS